MTDYGDEFGRDVEQSLKVVAGMAIMKALRDFKNDFDNRKYSEYPGHINYDKSNTKPNYIIEPEKPESFEIFFDNEKDMNEACDILDDYSVEKNHEFDSITIRNADIKDITKALDDAKFNEMGKHERIMQMREKTVCVQQCIDLESRDVIVDMLVKNGIAAEAVGKTVQYYKQDIPKIEVVIDDFIKSHDSMDLDTRTAVNEIDTPAERGQGSWKNDIAEKVHSARIAAEDENDFIRRCENSGIGVTSAKDGELMFVHPDGDHLKIRGDTLGEDYTHDSFKGKPIKLEDEARDMKAAARELAGDVHNKQQDKDINKYQNLTK